MPLLYHCRYTLTLHSAPFFWISIYPDLLYFSEGRVLIATSIFSQVKFWALQLENGTILRDKQTSIIHAWFPFLLLWRHNGIKYLKIRSENNRFYFYEMIRVVWYHTWPCLRKSENFVFLMLWRHDDVIGTKIWPKSIAF